MPVDDETYQHLVQNDATYHGLKATGIGGAVAGINTSACQ